MALSSEALAWAKTCCGVGSVAQLILILMADWADHEDRAWPGIKKLAVLTGRSERTVIRAIKRLEETGLIEKSTRSQWCALDNPVCMQKGPHKHRTSNVYKLNVGAHPADRQKNGEAEQGCCSAVEVDQGVCEQKTAESSQNLISDKMSLLGSISDKTVIPLVTPVSPICNKDLPEEDLPDLTLARQVSAESKSVPLRSGPVRIETNLAIDAGDVEAGSGDGERGEGEVSAAGLRAHRRKEPTMTPTGPLASQAPKASTNVCEAISEPHRGSRSGDGSGRQESSSEVCGDVGVVVAECLPPQFQALDAQGARMVAQLLRERLDAGWRACEIRSVMDQALPMKVYRMAALVASRLRRNVDPACAPARLRQAHEEHQRRLRDQLRDRQDRLFAQAQGEPEADVVWEEIVAQVRADMPGAGWAAWTKEAIRRRIEREGVVR